MVTQRLFIGIGWIQSDSKEIAIMSTLSSKPVRTYIPVESISIVIFLVLVISVLFALIMGSSDSSLNNFSDRPALLLSTSNIVFAGDLEYWNANCSHGWTAGSDSTCSEIVARTQSCANSVDSAYCAEYAHYLRGVVE